ncbi:MAG: nicotinamide-nucleotide amidohydrolase family protein [Chitinophagaceae bacterium]
MSTPMHDQQLLDRTGKLLIEKQQTLAVAESVTSGHLQAAFSLAENARKFFQGGITVYNLGQKTRHLQVEPVHALACNCVSEKVAAEMASHVGQLFLSDWGIAITGYASPVPEKGIDRLFACYAIYCNGRELAREIIYSEAGEPEQVQLYYTQQVVKHLLRLLQSG